MNSSQMGYYFQQIEDQRKHFYQNVVEKVEDPHKRPLPSKWSVCETTYHLMLLARLLRRFSAFYIPIMLPYAKIKKNRPYKTEIHNIYEEYNQKKKKPMKAPFVLTPPKNLSQNYNLTDILQLLNTETNFLKKKFSEMEEYVAGHIYYPDPIAHYPNVIQSIQLLAIHEQHHFDLVKKYEKN